MWLDRRLGCYRRRIRHRGDDRGSGDCRRRRQPSRLPERDLLADSRDRIPNPADDLVELALRQPQALLHAANLPHVVSGFVKELVGLLQQVEPVMMRFT